MHEKLIATCEKLNLTGEIRDTHIHVQAKGEITNLVEQELKKLGYDFAARGRHNGNEFIVLTVKGAK